MIVMAIKNASYLWETQCFLLIWQLILNVCTPNMINDTAAFSGCVQDIYFLKSNTGFYYFSVCVPAICCVSFIIKKLFFNGITSLKVLRTT